MSQVIALAGSPSPTSKSERILGLTTSLLEQNGVETATFSVRDFPAEDLFALRFDSPPVRKLADAIAEARAVVVAAPVYKAAYPGVLKALLDLLPQKSLAGKTVLPLITGGSFAHLLAVDYAFKPVFSALGATHLLPGVYITDEQARNEDGQFNLQGEPLARLEQGVGQLLKHLRP